MKRLFIINLLLFYFSYGYSQNSHLVFYSESKLFTVKLNDVKQNDQPTKHLKIKYYNARGGNVKITFVDTSIQSITSDLKFQTGMIAYFNIRKKGTKYVVEWLRELPYADRADTKEGHLEVNYLTPEGIRVNKPLTGKEYLMQYKGKKGCETPITYQMLRGYQTKVSSKSADNRRLKIALDLLDDKCFSVSQIKSNLKLFGFDELKADYAIAAYAHTFNQDDFKQVVRQIRNKEEKQRVENTLNLK